MGIFHTDKARSWKMNILATDKAFDYLCFGIALRIIKKRELNPGYNGGSPCLVNKNMSISSENNLIASPCMCQDGQLIPESSRGDQQSGFFSQPLCGQRFQSVHCGVIPVNIISNCSLCHCLSH